MTNLERMIALADEVFAVRSDPDQIAVDEEVRAKLLAIHPSTLTSEEAGDGPVAWILLIPTTHDVMSKFVSGEISEKTLLDETNPGDVFSTVYLCSALVLPEFRGKGIARRHAVAAIEEMRRAHPIDTLYYWKFSDSGEGLAESIARACGLPLKKRERH